MTRQQLIVTLLFKLILTFNCFISATASCYLVLILQCVFWLIFSEMLPKPASRMKLPGESINNNFRSGLVLLWCKITYLLSTKLCFIVTKHPVVLTWLTQCHYTTISTLSKYKLTDSLLLSDLVRLFKAVNTGWRLVIKGVIPPGDLGVKGILGKLPCRRPELYRTPQNEPQGWLKNGYLHTRHWAGAGRAENPGSPLGRRWQRVLIKPKSIIFWSLESSLRLSLYIHTHTIGLTLVRKYNWNLNNKRNSAVCLEWTWLRS